MEVQKVYMDLVEGVKKGKGWKLECEAFKKPIELQIHYDDTELAQFNQKISDIYKILEQKELVINELQKRLSKIEENQTHLLDGHLTNASNITSLVEQNGEQNDLINGIAKQLGNQNNTIETQSGTILQQAKRIDEIEKKITKQPMVFNDKCFISGHEGVILNTIQIPDGDYLVISKFIVGEHNEFVSNEDEILFNKVHIENGYDVWYELEGEGTTLDKPTATIFYNLVFIPC